MAPNAPIPCCDDLWGIGSQRSQWPASPFQPFTASQRLWQCVRLTEPGDIVVHRPFLSFPKADLLETCKSNNIPYVQDKTNFDPRLTQRNAVRALRSHHRLPRALQDTSILGLIENAREGVSDFQKKATDFLRTVSAKEVNLSSGLIELSIPRRFVELYRDNRLAAANVVERLAALVNPHATHLLAPAHFVDQVAGIMAAEPDEDQVTRRFSVRSVLFEAKVRSPGEESVIWRLSRCRPALPELKHLELGFAPILESRQGLYRSSTVLWDSRYWIRLHSSHGEAISAVKVRSFQESDMKLLPTWVDKRAMKRIKAMLRRMAPGYIQYTLPVLTCGGTPIALATLDSNLINEKAWKEYQPSLGISGAWLKWEIYYKDISDTKNWTPDGRDLGTAG